MDTDILRSMPLSALALNNGAVVVSWSFQAPIEAVWRGLTDPALLSRWLGTAVETDIRTGGRLVIDHGEGQLSRSEVIEAEAPHRLTMTWEFPGEPRSRVAVELRESDEGAAAKLTHTGPDLAASYGPGWTTHLTYLEAAVQGPDPSVAVLEALRNIRRAAQRARVHPLSKWAAARGCS